MVGVALASFLVSSLSTVSGTPADVLKTCNAFRSEIGLPAFKESSVLDQAASAHGHYQVVHHQLTHIEAKGADGYTGANSWDRAKSLGYSGICLEAVAQPKSVDQGVHDLFNSPYHRINFLQAGTPDIGISIDGPYLTIVTGITPQETVITSPSEGQRDIPPTITGPDLPVLLQVVNGTEPVGYPIIFGFIGPRLGKLSAVDVTVTDAAGGKVDCYANTPSNDVSLRVNGVFTPKRPLQPHTTYTVHGTATTDKGAKIDKTWKFTTSS